MNNANIEILYHRIKSNMLCLSVRDEEIVFLFCIRLNVHENSWNFYIVYLENILNLRLLDVIFLDFNFNILKFVIIYFLEVALPN